MKISVITASFNQARFIGRTLRSVAQQTRVEVEHIVLDPGSSDGSIDIIREHALAHPSVRFIQEPDSGQVDAINKGFKHSTGEVLTWLNSDDYYVDTEVLSKVAAAFSADPDVMVVYGKGIYVDDQGQYIKDAYVNSAEQSFQRNLSHSIGILQPALFMRRSAWELVGGLDEHYNLSLDYEYWLRLAFKGARFKFLDLKIAAATLHSNSKTVGQRGKQYAEICKLMVQYYGFVKSAWLQRYADFLVNGADGIVASSEGASPAAAEAASHLFRRYNATPSALYGALKLEPAEARLHVHAWLRHHRLSSKRALLTTASGEYFDQLLTLVAGVHRTSRSSVDVLVVYDLSLSSEQRNRLFELDAVIVLPYPGGGKAAGDWYYTPKSYAYKCEALQHWLSIVEPGSDVLWMDAGVTPLASVEPFWDLLRQHGAFFVNHDDRTARPFRNVNFTHVNALHALGATASEALAEHICSCLIGVRKGAAFDRLFEEAYAYSKIQEVSWWPKHLPDAAKIALNSAKNAVRRAEIEALDPAQQQRIALAEVIDSLPYYGHRQDQSIFSVLAARHRAVIISAHTYCRSTEQSSHASLKNWESGAEWSGIVRSQQVPEAARGALTFHHRGTFTDHSGLRTGTARQVRHRDSNPASDRSLLGPLGRERGAHFDETDSIAKLYGSALLGAVMIDVGAHIGSSMAPFLDQGWRVFAFEPDEQNRAKLLARVAKHPRKDLINIDTRCVSNQTLAAVPFYRSQQSTGISGLSAFHETHVEAQRVDTVTLTEFLSNQPVKEVDFLKIDTEGHDLFVLQGFPWHRFRPAVIECEFEDSKTRPLGYDFHELAGFLTRKGYRVYVSEWHPIVRYGIRHNWNRLSLYPCQLANDRAWGNLLAFRDEIADELVVQAVRQSMSFEPATPAPAIAAAAEAPKPGATPHKPAPTAHGAPAATARPENTLQPTGFAEALRDFREGKFASARSRALELAAARPDFKWYAELAKQCDQKLRG